MSASALGSSRSTEQDPRLFGETNEIKITLNNIEIDALLDTGSCVSLVSKSCYEQKFSNIPIQPLQDIINIECADGGNLPYEGYIELELEVEQGLPAAKSHHCLFLVSPDTKFSAQTPVILGTNILDEVINECKQELGENYLQKTQKKGISSAWYLAFRTIAVRNRELKKNKDRIAVLRSAQAERIILKPNESVDITTFTDKEINYPDTSAIIHESEESKLPEYLDITPGVVQYKYGKNSEIVVNVSNLTIHTICIPPKAIVCELQPVKVDHESMKKFQEELQKDDVLGQIHIDTENKLTVEQRHEINKLLEKHKHIFSTSDTDIGQCDRIKHRIDLLPGFETPFKQRHRRIPPTMIEEVRQHLDQLLSAGIIRKSKSPWASNVVLVRKKNGKLRVCVDYRTLNDRSIKDAYALPRIEEVFDILKGSKYFSTIDMKAGYHQVEIEDTHKERTAFTVGPLGFFEYVKMPFGLSNSPATYQRLMEECLGDYNMTICVIYIDDLIVFADTFEEHLRRLDLILTRLHECKLKLSPEKCYFIQSRVSFLGHVVSEDGIETDPAKIEKVKNWPTPSNPDELRSFLAFAGYYRRFIKDFSKITRPLADLLPPSTKKYEKKKPVDWKWTSTEQGIFDNLKEILTAPPILAYPDFTKPFELHTDASTKGLGAVLYQVEDTGKKVIAYASRSLTKSEKNYSAYKLEFLALKWAVTEKFSDYLQMNHFTVLTDNNPLTYILTTAKLDATGQRWAAALGEYNFEIHYRAGTKNADADGLSRYPFEKEYEEQDIVTVTNEAVRAVCKIAHVPPFIEVIPCHNINIVEVTENPGHEMAQVEFREIRRSQREDVTIERWRRAVLDQKIPQTTGKEDIVMKKNFSNFVMRRGILYRKSHKEDTIEEQLVVPNKFRLQVLNGLHTDVGHPGRDRTLRLLRERFFWPGMSTDVEDFIGNCDRCIRRKSSTNIKAPLVSVVTTYPLELVCMDFLSLETSKGGFSNILVITDHFSKYALAIPTKNQTAKTTADVLYNNFMIHYGIPTRLHSDQGPNFESQLVKELCKIMNCEKSCTTVYHPMGNASPERFNRTLLGMLGTLETTQKHDWKSHVPSLVYAYNCTPHESTNIAPFELMFGRKPKLPVDSIFKQATHEEELKKDTKEYLEELKERMKKTNEIVKKHNDKARERQKKNFDVKAKAAKICVGDHVLVRVMKFEGKHKIADKFEEEVYEVVEQPREEIPVYKLRSLDTNTEKLLHRNHLHLVLSKEKSDPKLIERGSAKETEKTEEKLVEEAEKTEEKAEEDRGKTDVGEESESDEESDIVIVTSVDEDAHQIPVSDHEGGVDNTEEIGDVNPIETEESLEVSMSGNDLERADRSTDSIGSQSLDEIERRVEENSAVANEREETTDRSTGVEYNDLESETIDVGKAGDSPDRVQPIATPRFRLTAQGTGRSGSDLGPVPTPTPRRSTRPKKPPERYKDYSMNSLVPRPVDSRLQAVNALMSSGVLNEIDSEVARKMLQSIMS